MKPFLVIADNDFINKSFSTREEAEGYVKGAYIEGNWYPFYQFEGGAVARWVKIIDLRDWIFED